MYAIKEAKIAKEHAHGDLECVIFNMDIRTFAKDYEQYYRRSETEDGIRCVKSRIHAIDEAGEDKSLRIRYVAESGDLREEVFDMVVLSVGLAIPHSTVELARRLDINLDRYNFASTKTFMPVETSRPGIFACGVFQGPKDIPSSITEASAAACAAGVCLAPVRGTPTQSVKMPDEIDVANQQPRIGVFVCSCGINIAGVVNVKAVSDYAAKLPNVVFTANNLFSCSQDSQKLMREMIREHRLNRVVVAACSPKTHEGIFMDNLEECGLNKYLFEMANIPNQN